MKIFDRIILTIYTFILALVSIILVIFPFETKLFSVENLEPYLQSIKGNYWFSIIGLAFLLVSIRFLISGVRRDRRDIYITRHTKLGELKISAYTIEGLAQSVTSKIVGINNIKTRVNLTKEGIAMKIKGQVNPDLNIPETTLELQEKIKEHIENCTGIDVTEVKIEISNISTPAKTIK